MALGPQGSQVRRIGGSPLAVQLLALPPYTVGQWIGRAPEAVRDVASEATAELLADVAEHLVLDLGELTEVSSSVAEQLCESINHAQRLGRDVCLVRCSDELFALLQRSGLTGGVRHAGSLLAATGGRTGEPASLLEMHLRSIPELLGRIRSVINAVAQEAGLGDDGAIQLKTAITEAATNAIIHGSPEGPRNHVRVSFHLLPEWLIVDIADQGAGFDPAGVPVPSPLDLRENGYGLHIMRSVMDRVEFFRDDSGMLVRLTKARPRCAAG